MDPEIQELKEKAEFFAGMIKELQPVTETVQEAAADVINSLAETLHTVRLKNAQRTWEVFRAHVDAGFTSDQALLLILDSQASFRKMFSDFNRVGYTKPKQGEVPE